MKNHFDELKIHNILIKGGKPIGTISNGYIKIADTGGKGDWVKMQHEHKNLSDEKREQLAEAIKKAAFVYGSHNINTQDKLKSHQVLSELKKIVPDFDYREFKMGRFKQSFNNPAQEQADVYYAGNLITTIYQKNMKYEMSEKGQKENKEKSVNHSQNNFIGDKLSKNKDGILIFNGKEPIGVGNDNAIFEADNRNQNVIKFPVDTKDKSKEAQLRKKYSSNEINGINMMKRHPEIFASTSLNEEDGQQFVLQEYLFTSEFKRDYHKLMMRLKNIPSDHLTDLYERPDLDSLIDQWEDGGQAFFDSSDLSFVEKLYNTLQKLKKIEPEVEKINGSLDLTPYQFGYDRDGNIKMMDFLLNE